MPLPKPERSAAQYRRDTTRLYQYVRRNPARQIDIFSHSLSQTRALVHQRFNSAKDWHCALMCSECRLYTHSASKALVFYQALAKTVNRLSSGVANSTPRKPEGLAQRSAQLDGQTHRQYRTGGRRQKVTVTRDGKGALVAPFFCRYLMGLALLAMGRVVKVRFKLGCSKGQARPMAGKASASWRLRSKGGSVGVGCA